MGYWTEYNKRKEEEERLNQEFNQVLGQPPSSISAPSPGRWTQYNQMKEQQMQLQPQAQQMQRPMLPDVNVNNLPQMVPQEVQNRRIAKQLDTTTGAPAGMRAIANIREKPEGIVSYLKARDDVDDAFISKGIPGVPDGKVIYYPKGSNTPRQFDEEGLSVRDFADFSGEAIEAVPGVIAGAMTMNPLGAAAGAAAGNALRQGISASLPGSAEMSKKERALSLIGAGGAGALGQYGANKLPGVLDKIRPSKVLGRTMVGDASETARRTALGKEMGIDLSVPQASGGRTALRVEGYLRQHPATADMMEKADQARLVQLDKYISGFKNSIEKIPLGKENTGALAGEVFDTTVKNIAEARGKQAVVDFGKVAAKSGNKPIIPLKNTVAAIKGIIDDYDSAIGSDSATKIRDQLTKTLSKLSENGELATPSQFQRDLSIFGKASSGSGNIITDLGDKAVDRGIATKIFSALQRDLDDAAGSALPGARELQAARNNYRAYSSRIDDLSNMAISKVVGKDGELLPGEKIVDKFFTSGWAPSQKKEIMKFMERQNPVAARNLKVEAIDRMMAQPTTPGTFGSAEDAIVSPAKIHSFFQKNKDTLKALYVKDPQGYATWEKIADASKILADRAGTGGSQTEPLRLVGQMVRDLKNVDLPAMVQDIGVGFAGHKALARAINTTQGRKSLLALTNVKTPVKQLISSSNYLLGLKARDEMVFDEDDDYYRSNL